jgi:hypothetical protein
MMAIAAVVPHYLMGIAGESLFNHSCMCLPHGHMAARRPQPELGMHAPIVRVGHASDVVGHARGLTRCAPRRAPSRRFTGGAGIMGM